LTFLEYFPNDGAYSSSCSDDRYRIEHVSPPKRFKVKLP
jgi:hypothetical protein